MAAAKKPPKQAQATQPAAKPRGPDEPNRLALIRLLADTGGRVYRAVTQWLTHEQKHVRVLGWITWLTLLGLFAAGVVVVLFRWDPLFTIAAIGGSTILVAGSNLVSKRRRG